MRPGGTHRSAARRRHRLLRTDRMRPAGTGRRGDAVREARRMVGAPRRRVVVGADDTAGRRRPRRCRYAEAAFASDGGERFLPFLLESDRRLCNWEEWTVEQLAVDPHLIDIAYNGKG